MFIPRVGPARRWCVLAAALLAVLPLCPSPAHAAAARNVILMISDGAGFNTYRCADYYQHGEPGKQLYDAFPVRLACTTYPLAKNGKPVGYDPNAAWAAFKPPRRAKGAGPTDSAAAATALYTGTKTTSGRISTGPKGERLTTIAEIAHRRGRRVGVVTTVQFSHATPACLGAHNDSRKNYPDIAREMLLESPLELIMGCGNPLWDNDGKPRKTLDAAAYKYVGGKEIWQQLTAGTTGRGWRLIQTKQQFEALARDASDAPPRLLGVPQVHETLQARRSGRTPGNLDPNVPDLPTMVAGALNFLHRGPEGFLLVVEGGAIDWANHANNLPRMLEEQVDFNRAVETVVRWIEGHGGWDTTLLIITSDHETGKLWGPQAGPPRNFQEPVNQGAGKPPLAKYFSKGHTNQLVPLFAKGPGSEAFTRLVKGTDPRYGKFVDNTDVFAVMRDALAPAPKAAAKAE